MAEESGVYHSSPPSDIPPVSGDDLIIDDSVIRETALDQDVDEIDLRDALSRIQAREGAVSLPTLTQLSDPQIVDATGSGVIFVTANCRACWMAEAEALGLTNAGADAVIETHRRQVHANTGLSVDEDEFGFVLSIPEFPTSAIPRLRALASSTGLTSLQLHVLILDEYNLSSDEIGHIVGLTRAGVRAALEQTKEHVRIAKDTVNLVDLPGVLSTSVSGDNPQARDWMGLSWSEWYSLERSAGELDDLPMHPGLYRVRHRDVGGLVYIGESGAESGLRGRIRSGLAKGVFDDDPSTARRSNHDAAQQLWALRETLGGRVEVSVATPAIASDNQHRRGIEAALTAYYRKITQTSPLARFGRSIPGHEFCDGEIIRPIEPGDIVPKNVSENDWSRSPPPWTNPWSTTADDWLGLVWTSPRPLSDRTEIDDVDHCSYRIWREEVDDSLLQGRLLYIGTTTTPQSVFFELQRDYGRDSIISVAEIDDDISDQLIQQRCDLELKTDLIGAHYLATGHSPIDQFRSTH